VGLCSGESLAHFDDVVFQKVFVQRMSDLQSADKCEHRYLLTAIRDLDVLALKEINVGFEAIVCPHFDREKVVVTPLSFLVSNILCEGGLGDFCEVVKRSECRE